MDISIIIPSYNTKESTVGCLGSIEDDTSNLEREVIVVDNASDDGTVETLEKLKFKNIKLTIVKNNRNIGFAGACNRGIRRSSGRCVLLLNSDTKVVKGAIEKLVGFAGETPDAGVVGAGLLNPDGSIQPSCFRFPTILRAIKQYWLNSGKILDKYYPRGNTPVKVEAVVGAAFLITPESIKKVGLLNEKYFMYFEDLDYCRRVRRKRLVVYYLPASKIIHMHGMSGVGLAEDKNQWKRLIPSSKIYHGWFLHYLITAVIWSGQKLRK